MPFSIYRSMAGGQFGLVEVCFFVAVSKHVCYNREELTDSDRVIRRVDIGWNLRPPFATSRIGLSGLANMSLSVSWAMAPRKPPGHVLLHFGGVFPAWSLQRIGFVVDFRNRCDGVSGARCRLKAGRHGAAWMRRVDLSYSLQRK